MLTMLFFSPTLYSLLSWFVAGGEVCICVWIKPYRHSRFGVGDGLLVLILRKIKLMHFDRWNKGSSSNFGSNDKQI